MYLYSVGLPNGPFSLDFDGASNNIWLGFATEYSINSNELRLPFYQRLDHFDITTQTVGTVNSIAIGCIKKETIVIPKMEYRGKSKENYPDWLKSRLLKSDYQHEIWLEFWSPLTGLLLVRWNYRSIIDNREVPCVHLAY